VQIIYAGLDDLVIVTPQVSFGLTDRQSQILPIPHRTIGRCHDLFASYFPVTSSRTGIHTCSNIYKHRENEQWQPRPF
jgi:hypothetical protein